MGGPPIRGDLLPLWDLGDALDPETARVWTDKAFRVALGVELVAHLEPILDEARYVVGFCAGSEPMARRLCAAVLQENIEARVARAHPPGAAAQPLACDVLLPCSPWATDEAVEQSVLGAVKASHAVLCVRPE
jgi:hypothetical protein